MFYICVQINASESESESVQGWIRAKKNKIRTNENIITILHSLSKRIIKDTKITCKLCMVHVNITYTCPHSVSPCTAGKQ